MSCLSRGVKAHIRNYIGTREDATNFALRYADSFERARLVVEMRLHGILPAADWFAVLGGEWSGFDRLWEHGQVLHELFATETLPIRPMMDSDELAAWQALPDYLTVYRGCSRNYQHGLSWSLNKAVANAFPFLSRYGADDPVLLTATVAKSRVIAVKLDRGEEEVVTASAEITSCEPATNPRNED